MYTVSHIITVTVTNNNIAHAVYRQLQALESGDTRRRRRFWHAALTIA